MGRGGGKTLSIRVSGDFDPGISVPLGRPKSGGTTMTETEGAAPATPAGVDTEKPSAARMYDWYLGGTHNWAVDREFGRKVERLFPLVKPVAQQNRAFMNRVVAEALDAGIRQFVDLGSGVPTAGNVHEIVRRRLPAGERATVVYVDYEPVAAAHGTLILERDEATEWAGVAQQDLRSPDAVFRHPATRRLIDFDQPVCLLLIAVLPFIGGDDRPGDLCGVYRDKLAPGSWFGLSHIACDDASEAAAADLRRFAAAYQDTSNPLWVRDRDEITPWFGDWDLLDPGVVHLPDWRPGPGRGPLDDAARPFAWCGVAERTNERR